MPPTQSESDRQQPDQNRAAVDSANPNPSDQEKIKDWTPAELAKYVLDLLERNPNIFLEYLKVDQLDVVKKINIQDGAGQDYNQITVGRYGGPDFSNSWANEAGYNSAGFYRDPYGYVHLNGMVTGGADGTSPFRLPPGYRPENKEAHVVQSLSGATYKTGWVEIDTDGTVTFKNVNGRVGMDGVRFRAKGF